MTTTRLTLAGIPITAYSMADAVESICQPTDRPYGGRDVHLLSAHGVYVSRHDATFRDVLQQATLVLPDGKWVARSGAWLGTPLSQVRGPELFRRVLDRGRECGVRHYFLAPSEACRTLLEERARELFPGIQIAGSAVATWPDSPAAEHRAQEQAIARARPDIVWLGIATPRQDFEAARLAQILPATIIAAGAALDFLAGTQAEAPAGWRKLGLEWLYRLGTDPRRLLKRYTVGNLSFIGAVAQEWMSRNITAR
ncbi:MAG: WecB/TagA/CpsF family glycosyltransferase [Microbacteriaceae bacterium]